MAQQARPARAADPPKVDLWETYRDAFTRARSVDLTHRSAAHPGLARLRAVSVPPGGRPGDGTRVHLRENGFEATRYELAPDQLGTQLDPPAHWAPRYPAIDELPATYAVRPLVVVSIVRQVRHDANYAP